jgi:hypothetical protein
MSINFYVILIDPTFNKITLSTRKWDLNLEKRELRYGFSKVYGAETWTLRKVDKKYVESFEIWCWRKMEKISWIDHMKNEVFHEVK